MIKANIPWSGLIAARVKVVLQRLIATTKNPTRYVIVYLLEVTLNTEYTCPKIAYRSAN